ncbi:unnamed protein product [Leuciscus chuanchicus]
MMQSRGRPDRYGCLLFRAVVPQQLYEEWASTTNWDGSRGKRGLPVNHQVDGGLNENEISQQLRSEDGRQNPPQTDTLRDEASTDSQQNYHLFFTDIHAALRELTATVTEQKVNIRELTATVTEQKGNIRELTTTVTEQKVNIRELTATVTEQKVNIRELTTTVTEQKANIRELTATVTEQKTINRELTATVTEQKANIRELTTTVTEQKANIRELTATVTEQKTINRELTANIRALETRLTEQQTFILEEMNKKNDEISNLTLSQVEELRKENRDREIAFSASLMQSGSGHIGPFTTEITLTYRNVFTNIGNAYNPVTGIFTAPLKGAYMFRVSLFGIGGPPTYVAIIKNGEHVVMAHDIQPQAQDRLHSSNGVVLILEVGDVVYVRLRQNKAKGKKTVQNNEGASEANDAESLANHSEEDGEMEVDLKTIFREIKDFRKDNKKEFQELKEDINRANQRLDETEERITTMEDRMQVTEEVMTEMIKLHSQLEAKLIDQEGCDRRNNIRIYSVPEGSEKNPSSSTFWISTTTVYYCEISRL